MPENEYKVDGFVEAVKHLIFDDGQHFFGEQECRILTREELAPFLYYIASDRIPGEWKNPLASAYRSAAARFIILEAGKNELENIFEAEKIRFAWLKGADYAFDIYPNPCLRLLGDLDLWCHPDDCAKIEDLLTRHAWKGHALSHSEHHYAPRHKKNVMIEPHFTLPNFNDASPEELWQTGVLPADEKGIRHKLTPEFNLLLINQHSSSGSWLRVVPSRVMTDSALLLKKHSIDWEKIDEFSERWGLLNPRIIPAAFPELFQNLPKEIFDPELATDYRHIILDRKIYWGRENELFWQESDVASVSWWSRRIKGMLPSAIRSKYHLEGASVWVLLKYWIRDFAGKLKRVAKSAAKPEDTGITTYVNRVKKVKSTIRKKPKD